jgi:RecB family exonuclease
VLDRESVLGVTTVLGKGVPKPALVNWAAETTAAYAVENWDELAELGLAARLKKLEKARFLGLKSAGERGTQVHTLAHKLAAGLEVDVPEELVGHVDAYLKFVEEWAPEELVAEAIIGNRKWQYMGTLDAVAKLADGRVWLLDFKTAAKGIFRESALQLAAYARAEFFLDADGNEHPLPEVEAAGAVWLRADGYDLIPVDISDDVFRTFIYAKAVAEFCDAPRENFLGESLRPPERETVAA